jgi:UDP-N-acetyl-D-glucosamine dehydrogenase
MTNETKDKNIAVIGLGYVGLPLAVLIAEKKLNVIAIDNNQKKVDKINRLIVPFKDAELQEKMNLVKLKATSDISEIKNYDIIIVCVPTPVDHLHNPDLGPVRSACESISEYLKPGHLVIIESTINPGVCEEVVQPILEKNGLKVVNDFDIAHCPERINPGDPKWKTNNIPRVVGASSEKGLTRAVNFYERILDAAVMPMKSIKAAEATKIIENTFRDINIAYVNELAKSFDKLGIDLFEVIKGASTKPFAFMPHFPGCGIGGHCIPVDPYYLIKRAKQNGFDHKFLRLAREINNSMPDYTVECLINELNELSKSVKGAKIGILGLSYKPDVDDTRESPVYEIIKKIKNLGGELAIYDPFVPDESTVASMEELLKKVDVMILATSHKQFLEMDLDQLKNNNIKLFIDGRNCLDKERILSLGIRYKGIGR